MKGTIRTKDKCPVCGKPFQRFVKGIGCQRCKTKPNKYYIDIYIDKQRKIYANRGRKLDSFAYAEHTQRQINEELDKNTFNIANYIKSEEKQFWACNLLDQMYADRIGNIAPSYRNGYTLDTDICKAFWDTKNVKEIGNYDVIEFDRWLKETGYNGHTYTNPNTRKKKIEHFRSFINYCLIDRQIVGVRMPKLPDIDTTPPVSHWMTEEDQQTIFRDFVPPKDKPVIMFMMIYGCRPNEARAIRCKDVDLDNDCFTISSGFSGTQYREKKRKGRHSKAVVLPIHDDMRDYITHMVNTSHPEAWLFPNPYSGQCYGQNTLQRIWKRIRAKAGIPADIKLSHATRHSRVTQEMNRGTTDTTTQGIVGHSDLITTQKHYSHIEVEAKRRVLQKYSLNKPQAEVIHIAERKTANINASQPTSPILDQNPKPPKQD